MSHMSMNRERDRQTHTLTHSAGDTHFLSGLHRRVSAATLTL